MSETARRAGERALSVSEAGKFFLVASIALVVVVADQATKLWIDASLRLHESVPVIDGLFRITYVRNTGAAFSLLADLPEPFRTPFFAAVAVLAGIAVAYFVRSTPPDRRVTLTAAGLVLGGAAGNLIDRLAYGSVIDFLDVYYGSWHWPAFNVADSSITIGVGLLLLQSVLVRD